jgi:6-phosphofructokinase 1
MRIGVLTGGGDCPGLNAVIRAVVRSAANSSETVEILGLEDGFDALVADGEIRRLHVPDVRGILSRGGTILGTTNRGDPFNYPVDDGEGNTVYKDLSDRCLARMREHQIDGLIVIGGDGTLKIAHDLAQKGVKVIGVPKTIDNDLEATAYTFGFDSAVNVAVEALDRLKTTAESHDRMMIMEVMGRYAGWIALHAGLAGGAHAVLIPEIPYSVSVLKEHLARRQSLGANHHLIVVAEGALPRDGDHSYNTSIEASNGAMRRLGGAADRLAQELAPVGIETRTLVLGHLQRGGSPTYRDRMLGTVFGAHAVALVGAQSWGRMVCLEGTSISDVPLVDAIGKNKRVPKDSEIVRFARQVGISFGTDSKVYP